MTSAEPTKSEAAKTRIIERIKKLMAVANNGAATEAEVESYARMARKLIEEHNISEHEVLTKSEDARASAYDSIKEEDFLSMARLVELHDKRMAAVAATICDCELYFRTEKNWQGKQVRETLVFYGLPTDLAVCRVFFAEIRATIKAMATVKYGSKWGTLHREYAVGFTSTLLRRSQELKRNAAQGYGIVLAKDALLTKWAANKLSLRSVKSKATKDYSRSSAYHQGRQDGNKFDLGVDRRIGG